MTTFKDWNLGYGGGLIQSLEEFSKYRETMVGPIGVTSGGYDPIHPGHITSIIHASQILMSKKLSRNCNPKLIVLVNDDEFLRTKKSAPFMDHRTRCQVISGIRGTDIVIPYSTVGGDTSINSALRKIKPDYFFKGGDRFDKNTIPEWETCEELKIKIITEVGHEKTWSSSEILSSYLKDFSIWKTKGST